MPLTGEASSVCSTTLALPARAFLGLRQFQFRLRQLGIGLRLEPVALFRYLHLVIVGITAHAQDLDLRH